MAITGAQVVQKARALLVDSGSVRWSDADLVGWLNTGQRQIAILKPDIFAMPVVVDLVPGVLQTITGLEFIKVNCNIGAGGARGTAVTPITQDILDRFYPGWMAATPSQNAVNYMFDPRDSQDFLVYPPQPVSPGKAEIIMIPYPADVTIVTGTITGPIIDDIFEGPLIDYVVYRGLSEDTETADYAVADKFYQQFLGSLGGLDKAEAGQKAGTTYANRA